MLKRSTATIASICLCLTEGLYAPCLERIKPRLISYGSRSQMENVRVLIVDDSPVNLQVAAGLLEPYHMAVDLAASGAEAIELAKKNFYDLVMLDHMMPEMDGVETAERLRALPIMAEYRLLLSLRTLQIQRAKCSLKTVLTIFWLNRSISCSLIFC